jgi:osmotically-inducible protein OsmY
MTRSFRSSALTGLLAAFAVSACLKAVDAPHPAGPGNATTSSDADGRTPATAQTTMPDADVQAEVNAELARDKNLNQAGIQVKVTSGIVELTGKVDNLISKERSTRIAESVRGVRAVSNRVEISASPRPDQDMQRDVRAALLYNAATAKMPIQADVKAGTVTLTGTVESWQEKQLAGRIADGVRGVRLTQNDLLTKYKAKRTDSAIAADVRSRLQWDALVEHDPVEANVTDGRVVLSGSVGSAAEKSRAAVDAWVDGVSSIDATGIVVQWWDRHDSNLRRNAMRSDIEIAAAIKQAAFYDPRVKSFNINPSVTNGIVTLTGTVETLNAKMAAEALARNTVGVVAVENQLVARPRESATDLILQGRLRDALTFDPLLEANEVFLTVNGGQVKLTGTVGSFFERAEATDVASGLSGVTLVDDELKVREPGIPYVYSAYLDPYTPYVTTWYVLSARPLETDSDITTRIKNGFLWSPFVHASSIHVNVVNGKATLTGTVHSFRERQAASDNALDAGAITVDNELKVG